ncbi:type II toxin-antitoxin system HipA family toxin [uncultured Devosia sp.]|uniref:type II toxin-antitoxin system HipA family toxin n=1 Tax=uncultured Devosia sp. TaxID=211434 RepID=UPI002634A39D|nr:type II toxin-antitoxin system HipA family toxin [uncultured Devosia sp.]
MTDAAVKLWGTQVGAVSWDDSRQYGVFQFAPEMVESGIEIAPLTMPSRTLPYSFPALPRDTFKGLPGLLADSLPDKYGNKLIDTWLARQGRAPNSFNPVERLCYIGTRGVGALEFEPATNAATRRAGKVNIGELVDVANQILDERGRLKGKLSGIADDEHAMEDILRVGTSAGGARAKAVLSWNERTGEFRSGQVNTEADFEHWLLKFDGVDKNSDKELVDPQGFGRIEFAYHLMATACGIEMSRCRLHLENGRAHFMTRRFDRPNGGGKLHMQSLTAMMHYDFNVAGAHSYEQAIQVLRRLDAENHDIEQQVLRALFNVVGRNQDDHPKNIAYLMDRDGQWRLSPAFDVAYAYNPSGEWTNRHQMSLNGKRDGFDRTDLITFGRTAGLKAARVESLLDAVVDAVERWPDFAAEAGVLDEHVDDVQNGLRHHAVR